MNTHVLRELPSCTIAATVEEFPPTACPACLNAGLRKCVGLNHEIAKELSSLIHRRQFSVRECLQNEGDSSTVIGIIARGTAAAVKYSLNGRRQIVGFLSEGSLFGVPVDGLCFTTVEAITDVSACLFPYAAFESAIRRHPELVPELMSIVTHDLAEAADHQLVLGRMTSQQRIATFLLQLVAKKRSGDGYNGDIELVMTRSDIADYLGLSMEGVSRGLSQFAHDGIIDMPVPHRIRIVKPMALEYMME